MMRTTCRVANVPKTIQDVQKPWIPDCRTASSPPIAWTAVCAEEYMSLLQ